MPATSSAERHYKIINNPYLKSDTYLLILNLEGEQYVLASSNNVQLLLTTEEYLDEMGIDVGGVEETYTALATVGSEITDSIRETESLEYHYMVFAKSYKYDEFCANPEEGVKTLLYYDETLAGSEFYFFRLLPFLQDFYSLPKCIDLMDETMQNEMMDACMEEYSEKAGNFMLKKKVIDLGAQIAKELHYED